MTVQNGLWSTSSMSETFQRLRELELKLTRLKPATGKIARQQTELPRDVAAIRENQARLERRMNELPQQQRTASLLG